MIGEVQDPPGANPNEVPSGGASHSIESNVTASSTVENEPRLSYAAFGSDVPGILTADAAARLCVSDKVLALGTESGAVHILDLEGNKIRTYKEHTATITDLSFDENAENLASSSSDGSIVVVGLYSDEVRRYSSSHPVTTVALDPRWAIRKTKELIYGTSAGTLLLVSKGWLGNTETILFQGRSPVTAVRMAGTLLAWSTDTGVRVYDTSNHARLGKIDPPPQKKTSKVIGGAVATLEWASRRELLIGWGRRISVVDVLPVASQVQHDPTSPGLTPAISRFNIHTAASFDVNDAHAVVLGIATFGNQLAVLTWQPPDKVTEAASNGYSTDELMHFRVYTRGGSELFADAVDLKGATLCSGRQQPPGSLAALCPTTVEDASGGLLEAQQSVGSIRLDQESDQAFKWWPDGADPLYFIVSKKDIVLGRPRDAADRIAWLISKERFNEALEVADSDPSVGEYERSTLAEQYLQYLLFEKQQYADAAALCPRILGRDAAAWERWVYVFGQATKLPVLAPYLPVLDPTLSPGTYDLAVLACLRSRSPGDHARLVSLVESWPAGIYDAVGLLAKVRERLEVLDDELNAEDRGANKGTAIQTELRRAAAALLTALGRHAEALQMMVQLRSLLVFDYIRQHALTTAAGPLAAGLIEIDEVKAISLLADAPDEASPEAIVRSLMSRIEEEFRSSDAQVDKGVWSGRLYRYLDWLWRRDAFAAAPFAEVHVRLCAAHDPGRLLHLLATSTSYPLDAALEVCEEKGLVRESVYVLGRMGSADAALRLMVEQLRDVEGALDFVADQQDPQLWELLVSLTLGDAALMGELLDRAGGGPISSADPARLVAAVPEGMAIEKLRDRLVRLIREFRRTVSLQEGCSAALRADCLELADKLYAELTRALRGVHLLRAGARWMLYDPSDSSGRRERVAERDAVDIATASKGVRVQPPRSSLMLQKSEGFTPPASVHASPKPDFGILNML